MAKYSGMIGYGNTVEDPNDPGVWKDVITERHYYGDVLRNTRRTEGSENGTNDNINVSNQISIVADAYAREHFFEIRYITWQNSKWKVSNVEVQRPRLVLTIGGLYNG